MQIRQNTMWSSYGQNRCMWLDSNTDTVTVTQEPEVKLITNQKFTTLIGIKGNHKLKYNKKKRLKNSNIIL